MFNGFLVKYVAIFFVIMDVLYIAFGYFMLIPMEDIFMGKKLAVKLVRRVMSITTMSSIAPYSH